MFPRTQSSLIWQKILDKQGIINYGTVFKAYLAVKGDSADDVLAGEYQLNPSMDYGQIIDKLTNSSSSDTLQITIPEGYSVAQVRQLLLDNHVCTADALDKVLNQYPFKHDFLQDEKPVEEGWLEGYLFPDTYEIYKGNGSVVDTVNKMLNNFASRYGSEITDGANELGRCPCTTLSLSPRLSSAKRSAMMNVRASRALSTTV